MRSFIFSAIAAISLIAGSAADCEQCVTDSEATQVAQNFATLISNYTETFANQSLAVDFQDQTDSVAWLINNGTNCPKPLGALTIASRAEFEAAQATQPNLPFSILNVLPTCTNITVRYRFDITPQPVQGIAIFGVILGDPTTDPPQFPWVIQTVLSEFNTGAFAEDTGLISSDRVSPAACPA